MNKQQKQEIKKLVLELSDLNTFDNWEKLYNYIDKLIMDKQADAINDTFSNI